MGGNSRYILEKMIADLSRYMAEQNVRFDLYRESPNVLESATYAVRARVALYTGADVVEERVGAYKAGNTQVRYTIDLTVWRGYKNDRAENAELVLVDYFDKIIDWSLNCNPSVITSGRLLYWGYDGSTDITRLERTVTQSLRFIGLRDFLQTQS